MSTYYTDPKYGLAIKEGSSTWTLELNNLNQPLEDSDLSQLQSTYREDYAPNSLKYILYIETDSNYIAQNPFLINNIDDFINNYISTPPASEPKVGDKYIVKTTGTDAFAGQDEKLAVYINNVAVYDTTDATQWVFLTPDDGYKVQSKADNKVYRWNDAVSAEWGEV